MFEGRQKITTSEGSTLLVQLSGRAIPKVDPKTKQPIEGAFQLTNMVGEVMIAAISARPQAGLDGGPGRAPDRC